MAPRLLRPQSPVVFLGAAGRGRRALFPPPAPAVCLASKPAASSSNKPSNMAALGGNFDDSAQYNENGHMCQLPAERRAPCKSTCMCATILC